MGIQSKKSKANTTLLTTRQVADRLQLKPSTILDYIKRGLLPAFDVSAGSRTSPLYRIKESDLELWIDKLRDEGLSEGMRRLYEQMAGVSE